MRSFHECNFAGRLLDRLSEDSSLVDAPTQRISSSAQISQCVAAFAAGFLSSGLERGDRVLISCGINSASVLAYLGAMYAGLVPVVVDERLMADAGGNLFTRARAKAAWTSAGVRWDWARKNGFQQFEGYFDSPRENSFAPAPCEENDVALLMPTSGSTGVPRLVMVTHANLIANTEAIVRSQNLGPAEKAMLIMPVSYSFGASVTHTHLYAGGSVVFDSRFMFPDKVLQAINTYGCTTFAGVPTVYNILLRRSNLASISMPTLKRFLQAGGPLSAENVQQMRKTVPSADFFVMYGQTEATARISCLPPDQLETKLGSAGIPLDNLTIGIIDDQGGEVPNGETGEVAVSGPSVCAGYLDDPEATQGKFVDGWLRTGDLGAMDEDGYLWIKGRIAEFVKIRGYRVSLADVEAKVGAVPGVCECAAAGVPHPEAGEALAVFIVEDGAGSNGREALVESVRRSLPVQWTCTSVKIVPELPKTPNGKIARSQLRTIA